MGFFKSKKSAAAVDEEISELEKSTNIDQSTTKPQEETTRKQEETTSIASTSTTTTIPTQVVETKRLNLSNDSFIHVQLPSSVGQEYSDKASTVLPLVSHHVKCHVTYPIVQVVSTMTFQSTHSSTIEGELVLPMPDGATMMGYAMEVAGKLVDAVPVEKEKAKAVFESEVRAGGTVSIVEKMTQASNCFKTKVYPMHPNQDKTVQVKYQIMLNEKVDSNDDESGTVKGSVFIPIAYLEFDKLRTDSKIEFTLNETSLQGYETDLSMNFFNDKIEKENQLMWTSKNVSKRSAYFQITKDQMKENMTGFNFSIKKESTSVNDILLAVENGYFMTSVPVPKLPESLKNQSRIGDKIQLIWDSSLSQESCHAKKVEKLKKIIEGVGATSIVLTQFSCGIIKSQSFTAEELLKFVESDGFVYDGGSNMLLFDKDLLSDSVDYCIAFTDGVHTFGHEIGPMCAFNKPIYFVNFSSIVNSTLLKHISTKSGGIYLNANELSDSELINSIGKPVLSFAVADFEESDLKEVYPNEPVTLAEGEIFKLYGMFNKNTTSTSTTLAVSFRYGPKVFHVQELTLPISEMTQTDTPIVPYLWAQKKIECLSAFPHLFKEEIKQIGFDFRIVTDSSSLVVLEKLDQYVKHDITPPETLPLILEEFNKKKKQIADEKLRTEKDKIERIVSMWKERVNWHKKEFNLPTLQKQAIPKFNDAVHIVSSTTSTSLPVTTSHSQPLLPPSVRVPTSSPLAPPPPPGNALPPSTGSALPPPIPISSAVNSLPPPPSGGALPPPPQSSSVTSSLRNSSGPPIRSPMRRELSRPSQSLSKSKSVSRSSTLSSSIESQSRTMERESEPMQSQRVPSADIIVNDEEESSDSNVPTSVPQSEGKISIKAWTPNAAYCSLIKSAIDPYKEYLTQRKSYRGSPAFYLDVADLFLTSLNSKELGVRILSNIAELELENVQLYRIVGYRLDQAEELTLAEWVFEKIRKISPHEPQSYRDLALVKERMGKLEESMQLFNKVISDAWDSRFDEIEMTAATEMNHLLAKNPDLPIVDKRLIHNFDLDIRISMGWDTDMVDIDLHVQEPSPFGEHAYYAHNRTTIGGYVSRDFRQGYGPEEYMVKKAPKGVYKATTNYFSNHSQSLTGGTTILCTFFTNYMRPEEKRQMVTIRLSSHKQDIEICDIEIA